ncbi:MAG: hypothetical protein IJ533_02900 [Prevotella sp.]|nr:hypothetical protein [Prevotella sp.]
MKKLQFLTMAAAATLFVACADENVLTPEQARDANPESNAITFGTYMGKSGMTRTVSGQTGALTTAALQASASGFGVFAYYTPVSSDKYTYWNSVDGDKEKLGTNYDAGTVANFMYNQQVKWNSGLADTYVTKWEYSPMKYWPNEISNTSAGADDDQDNDASNNQAKGSGTYGGNISFFAYAPYVGTEISGDEGITEINGATTLLGDGSTTGNAKAGDPTITYVIPAAGKDMVDLLWGTKGNTSTNVLGLNNAGGKTGYGTLTGTTYDKASEYDVNINLNKQKTNGVIDFAFKHALAKVGGSQSSVSTLKHGLLVVLDTDDLQGAETGGTYNNEQTKVTITDIKIVARSIQTPDNGSTPAYDPIYFKKLQGTLNLATGEWIPLIASNLTETTDDPINKDAATTTHIVVAPASTQSANKSADIADDLAEPGSLADGEAAWRTLPEGVLLTPKNVYKAEAEPLLFIPETYPELTITIEYNVRTLDKNLQKEYTEVKQNITKRITFANPVKLNKQYSIIMHLGLTGVKFTAQVSDWELKSTTDSSPADGVVDEVEVINLPINVRGAYLTTFTATNVNLTYGAAVGSMTAWGNTITSAGVDKDGSAALNPAAIDYVYSINDGSTWLTLGTGTDNGKYTATANPSNVARTAEIKVAYGGTNDYVNKDSKYATFTVTQPAGFNTAFYDGSDAAATTIAAAADSKIYLKATLNDSATPTAVDQTITVTNLPSWLTATWDDTNKKVAFTATANGTVADRTATVKVSFTQGGVAYSGNVTVTQTH